MAKRSEWAKKRIQEAREKSQSIPTEADFPTPEPIDPFNSRLVIARKIQTLMKGGTPPTAALKQAKGTVYDLRLLLTTCERINSDPTIPIGRSNEVMDASRLAWDVVRHLADAVDCSCELLKSGLRRGDSEEWPALQRKIANKIKSSKITKREANIRAREILVNNPSISLRDLASEIPCSNGLVAKLGAWKAFQETRKDSSKPDTPKVVSLTDALESTCGDYDPELQRLIEEQGQDMKSDAGRHFQQRKKL